MSPKLQPVRGTHDILPDEFERFHAVVTRARELATLYGFKEMATPIFEPTEVFSRSMGETSDVVSKEMFSFETKGGESVTLRPEFTAGIVRAFLSNGMQQHLPLKLFSTGPLFRYERPQKGRQRQFHQVNFEWLGDASPEADVEVIMLAGQLLYYLTGKSCKLLINTLGDSESRVKYREALVDYLQPYTNELSEDSQRRLISNPLRILDSKSPQDQEIVKTAPTLDQYLTDEAKQRFDRVYSLLEKQQTPVYQSKDVDYKLVRGLDYYSHTVFEFVDNSGALGAQSTVLAGGRYDGLVEQMGGKPVPAIGFAAGVERLMLIAGKVGGFTNIPDIHVVVIAFEEVLKESVLLDTTVLRIALANIKEKHPTLQKYAVDILWNGSVKKRMEKAAQMGASHVLLMAPEEIEKNNAYIVKNMDTGVQTLLSFADMPNTDKLCEVLGIIKLDSGRSRNDEAQS